MGAVRNTNYLLWPTMLACPPPLLFIHILYFILHCKSFHLHILFHPNEVQQKHFTNSSFKDIRVLE